MRRILLVDEDGQALDCMSAHFQDLGINLTGAHNGALGLSLCARNEFDLVVMENALPDMMAHRFLVYLRDKANNDIPVIVLSHEADTDRKVVALKLGADRYMTKPFHPAELAAMMEAIFRRARSDEFRPWIGSLLLDRLSRIAIFNGKKICLEGQEYQALECLMMRKNTFVTLDMLNQHGGTASSRSPQWNVVIRRLSKKFKKVGASFDLIKNVPGKNGYIISTDPEPASRPMDPLFNQHLPVSKFGIVS